MSHRSVLRYEIPIDDQLHQIAAGKVLMAVPHRQQDSPVRRLEVWVETDVELENIHAGNPGVSVRTLIAGAVDHTHVQVYGTGHMLPDEATHLATCVDRGLVWHLYERPA